MNPAELPIFIEWLTIIGAVCLTVTAGAVIDRFLLNRKYRPAYAAKRSTRRIRNAK